MSSDVEKLISIAKKEVGVTESPAGSNKVKYNTWYYGREVSGSNYSWCAVFQNWIFQQAGLSDLFYGGGKTASCTTLRDFYKSKEQLVTSDYKPGDLVFLHFKKAGICEHIGLIVGVSGTTLTTIEGNTGSTSDANGGAVMTRTRYPNQITDVARPVYHDSDDVSYSPSKTDVKSIQTYLNTNYSSGLVVDGIVGTKTKYSIVKALQKELNSIYSAGLVADGDFGDKTKSAVHSINVASKGKIQYIIQIGLILKQESLTLDGVFGTKTVAAVKAFQKASGLTADGIVGKNTMELLMK